MSANEMTDNNNDANNNNINKERGSTETVSGEEGAISEEEATPSESSEEVDTAPESSKENAASELATKIGEEFTCPLSHQVMTDPVMAEDRNMYEKEMILQYFKQCQRSGQAITSPVTREQMGTTLTECRQVKTAIVHTISNMQGEVAESWRKSVEMKKSESL